MRKSFFRVCQFEGLEMSESQGKSGSFLTSEMLVGISAVVIGVCALFVSLYETKLMRQEQRAAVLPIIELSRSFYAADEADDSSWRVLTVAENVGIGPARILDFEVTVDGKPHATWRSAIQALTKTDTTIRYSQSTINGRTVPPDRSITMFSLEDSTLAKRIIEEFHRLDYKACYCSSV